MFETEGTAIIGTGSSVSGVERIGAMMGACDGTEGVSVTEGSADVVAGSLVSESGG